MKSSLAPMNAVERAYVDACKWDDHDHAAFCVACLIREESKDAPPFFVPLPAHHFHHFCSGGIRVGHLWGVGLCIWHHERHPVEHWTHRAMERHFGPSLKGGSAVFHATYGSDAELLKRQDDELENRGIQPPERPENRRWAA